MYTSMKLEVGRRLDVYVHTFRSGAGDLVGARKGKSGNAVVIGSRHRLLWVERGRRCQVALSWKGRKHVVLVRISNKAGGRGREREKGIVRNLTKERLKKKKKGDCNKDDHKVFFHV